MSTHEERQPLLPPSDAAAPIVASYTDPGAGEVNEGGSISNNEEERPRAQVLAIIIPVSIGVFLAAMDVTIVASSYAAIGSDLKQLQNTSWIATGYMLTLTAFQPLYGKLSDIFGRKSCLLFAYSIFGIGCLACGFARNMTELIAARIFAGIGGGGMTTVVSILLSDVVPLRERGTWQGVINIVFFMGSASGAPLGGVLADSIGWRWAFLLQAPATLLAFLAVLFVLHPPTKTNASLSLVEKLAKIDFLGAIALIIAVFGVLLGLDHGSNVSWGSPWSYGPLVISLVASVIFALVESTPSLAKEPFAPKRIMVNPGLVGSYLTNFFVIASTMSSIFFMPLYAQAVSGKTPFEAGLLLIPATFSGVSGSLLSGIIMQRTGKYRSLTLGAGILMVMGSLVIVIMAFLSKQWSLVGMIAGQTTTHLAAGVIITTTLIALISNVTEEDQAVVTAVSYLFRSLGSVLGVSVGSAVFQNKLRQYLTEKLIGRGLDVDEIVRRVRESLQYLDTLDPELRLVVRGSYERALASAFCVGLVIAFCALISALFIREKALTQRK